MMWLRVAERAVEWQRVAESDGSTSTITPSGKKVSEAEREKNAINSGHLVP
jgi:hypothetical protein